MVDECCGINSREAMEPLAEGFLRVSAKFQRFQRESMTSIPIHI